jgi:hypothetical protein
LRAAPIGDDRCQARTIRPTHQQAKIPSHPGSPARSSAKENLVLWTIH